MSLNKHFGNLNTIKENSNLSGRLDKLNSKINQFLEYAYESRNSFSSYQSEFGNWDEHAFRGDSKSQKVISKIADMFCEEFKGHTYLRGVKLDESKGRILKSDISRYISAYFGFLGTFKYFDNNDKYNVIESITMDCIEIPVVREFKMKYIMKLLNLASLEALDEYIKNPLFDYVKVDLEVDKNFAMYELFIDANKKITYSNFYNSYIMDTFEVGTKYKEYIIYKLSELEVSMTDFFNGELKEYMHKTDYERVINKYVGAYENKYGTELFDDIKNKPIITKYLMINAINEGISNSPSNKEYLNNKRLSDVLSV